MPHPVKKQIPNSAVGCRDDHGREKDRGWVGSGFTIGCISYVGHGPWEEGKEEEMG
jgi:hypothetical protein